MVEKENWWEIKQNINFKYCIKLWMCMLTYFVMWLYLVLKTLQIKNMYCCQTWYRFVILCVSMAEAGRLQVQASSG